MVKILVVDDDEILRMTLKRVLDRDHMLIILASTAKEALSILKEELVELIITDVKMPEMDGLAPLDSVKRVVLDNVE